MIVRTNKMTMRNKSKPPLPRLFIDDDGDDDGMDSRAGLSRRDVTRLLVAFLAVVTIIGLPGCRSRVDHAQTSASPNSPPVVVTASHESPSNAVAGVVESKSLAIKDEAFDLAFAEEKQQTYQLSPGATVRIERINGKIEIQKSASDSAELYIVRSVENRDDLKNRTLIVEHKPHELVIRMERARRSALFSMFSDRGSEKQRIVLKLPRKVGLNVDGASGRVNVAEIDGDVHIEGVNGRVALAHVTGTTSLSGINGQVRVIADGRNKNDLKVEGVNGGVELLFNGTVNADLRVEAVRGNVDAGLPNLVYDGERRQNNFRAKAGKGGALIDISGVRGRVRLAPAAEQDLVPAAATASAK